MPKYTIEPAPRRSGYVVKEKNSDRVLTKHVLPRAAALRQLRTLVSAISSPQKIHGGAMRSSVGTAIAQASPIQNTLATLIKKRATQMDTVVKKRAAATRKVLRTAKKSALMKQIVKSLVSENKSSPSDIKKKIDQITSMF